MFLGIILTPTKWNSYWNDNAIEPEHKLYVITLERR